MCKQMPVMGEKGDEMKVRSGIDVRGNWFVTTAINGDGDVREADEMEKMFFAETGLDSFNYADWSRFWDDKREVR